MSTENKTFYNLTHPQKRIWYTAKTNTDSQLHNLGGCLKIKETVNVEDLRKVLNKIIKLNEGLRIRVAEKNGQPVQYISEYEEETIEFRDFSISDNPREEHKIWVENTMRRTFALENNPLYYFALYKICEKEYGILLNIHHIIADGWSISLIQKQICQIYCSLNAEFEKEIDEIYSYTDYISKENEYLNSERFLKNKKFWNEKFNDLPEGSLYKTSISLEGKRETFKLDNHLSSEIKQFLEVNKSSLNTFFVTVFLIYVNKVKNERDIVLGTPIFNRSGNKEKNMIGMFTSTMPFRMNLNTELSIKELINVVNRELKTSFINQRYPYDLLIGDLELSKKGFDSLFKFSVNYYNSKYEDNLEGIDIEVDEYYNGNQSYSLQLIVKEWLEGHITLNFDYKTSEYSNEDISVMKDYMVKIAKEIIENGDLRVKDIKLLSEDELNCKTHIINSTDYEYPKDKTISELFEEQVEKTPENIAVSFEKESLTYRELNEKANQFANYLKSEGINKQDIVAIMETHSLELIISILGVLKAGAAYLPIDPTYPLERVKYILEDSNSSMILTNYQVGDESKFSCKSINVKDLDVSSFSKRNLEEKSNAEDLVYIIYTSGSTGKPKGVMIEHRGLVNYICWATRMYLKDKEEVVPLYSSVAFDLTVTSIFTPLVSGNQIIIYEKNDDEFVLFRILEENKATVIKLTPAHLTLLKDLNNTKSKIKRFIVGGDDLKVTLARDIFNSFQKNIEIFNEYGPTEAVVGCMIHKYDFIKNNDTSVPIGYPADNVQIYILDKDYNIVPDGTIGELFISGDGVARGYINNEALTNSKFMTNPFIEGKKMYRTGDLARYLENGIIEYIGRIDNQVKIRGFRIEVGEIEESLMKNKNIKDAVVVYRENTLGSYGLDAFIVRREEIVASEIKQWLLKFLPQYMIPANFIFLEKLPLTTNGKIDYGSLPNVNRYEKTFIECESPEEKFLIRTLEEVLDTNNISMNDNFYNLGGDSIKAIQISSKLKDLGLTVEVKDILTLNSIKEIANTINVQEESKDKNDEVCEGNIPLTPIMKWFFNQEFHNESYYNQYTLLENNRSIDINIIKTAIRKIVEHHDILRVNYNRNDNTLYYNNSYLQKEENVEILDLSKLSYDEQLLEIENLRKKLRNNFNIESTTLFKLFVFELGERGQALLFTAHHLLVDGISWRIILEDFITIINQLHNSKDVILPVKTSSFKQWAEKLYEYSKNDFSLERNYWEDLIEKNIHNTTNFKGGKDTIKTSITLYSDIDSFSIEELIKSASEIYGMKLNEALIAALVITVNKWNNEEDIIIELERHGRESIDDYTDVSRTVGWFTSMYPAYFKVAHDDIEYNFKAIKEQLRNIPNKGFNYSIIKYLKEELKESQNNIIRFNYLGDFDNIVNDRSLGTSNIQCGLESDENNGLTSLLDITAMIVNKKLRISITYGENSFKRATVQSFIDAYKETLKFYLNYGISKCYNEIEHEVAAMVAVSQED